jgi:hypothetical protein
MLLLLIGERRDVLAFHRIQALLSEILSDLADVGNITLERSLYKLREHRWSKVFNQLS